MPSRWTEPGVVLSRRQAIRAAVWAGCGLLAPALARTGDVSITPAPSHLFLCHDDRLPAPTGAMRVVAPRESDPAPLLSALRRQSLADDGLWIAGATTGAMLLAVSHVFDPQRLFAFSPEAEGDAGSWRVLGSADRRPDGAIDPAAVRLWSYGRRPRRAFA